MNAREDKIRQVVAELDAHVAEVEARVAILGPHFVIATGPGGALVRYVARAERCCP